MDAPLSPAEADEPEPEDWAPEASAPDDAPWLDAPLELEVVLELVPAP